MPPQIGRHYLWGRVDRYDLVLTCLYDPKYSDKQVGANSVDPDLTASGAV